MLVAQCYRQEGQGQKGTYRPIRALIAHVSTSVELVQFVIAKLLRRGVSKIKYSSGVCFCGRPLLRTT